MNGLEFINFAHNYDPNKTNADDNFILKKKEKFIKDISKIRKDIMDKIKECIEELKKLEP
jgi:hypothetical protein